MKKVFLGQISDFARKMAKIYRKNDVFRVSVIFVASLSFGISLGSSINFIANAGAESKIISETDKSSLLPRSELIGKAPLEKSSISLAQIPVDFYGLSIPEIGLYQDVSVSVQNGTTISVPAYGVSVWNGNLLLGHNPGVFSGLYALHNLIQSGKTIQLRYGGNTYITTGSEIASFPGAYNLKQLNTASGTKNITRISSEHGLVLMTCFGPIRADYNYTAESRILIYAERI